ncbi:MAG: NUDIX domain-containing protein [Patescibacteria group bacterium]
MAINYNAEDIVDHDGIAAVIKNERGDILVQEHVKYGFWTIPVGKVKGGQSIIDGLKQEILEECDLEILECAEITHQDYFYKRGENDVKVVSHLFEITKYSGEMRNAEPLKHKQQIFMPLQEIEKLPFLSDLTLLYLKLIGINREAHLQV